MCICVGLYVMSGWCVCIYAHGVCVYMHMWCLKVCMGTWYVFVWCLCVCMYVWCLYGVCVCVCVYVCVWWVGGSVWVWCILGDTSRGTKKQKWEGNEKKMDSSKPKTIFFLSELICPMGSRHRKIDISQSVHITHERVVIMNKAPEPQSGAALISPLKTA